MEVREEEMVGIPLIRMERRGVSECLGEFWRGDGTRGGRMREQDEDFRDSNTSIKSFTSSSTHPPLSSFQSYLQLPSHRNESCHSICLVLLLNTVSTRIENSVKEKITQHLHLQPRRMVSVHLCKMKRR